MIHEILPVGMLQCNCSVFGDEQTREGWWSIPGDDIDDVLAVVRQHGLTVKAIVITHAHIDHIGGAQKMKAATGAPVYMNVNDSELQKMLDVQAAWLGMRPPAPVEIDAPAKDGDRLVVGHERGPRAAHAGAHAGQHQPVDAGEGKLVAGDTLFRDSIGRTDLPGGDGRQILRSIHDKLMPLPDETVVVPGHGPNTTIGREKRLNPFPGGDGVMQECTAARLQERAGAVQVQAVDMGEPGPGEALVRMEACGVCHSDLFVSGLEKLAVTPLTLGHEGIGRIEALGPDADGWAVGDRVGITFLGTTCGACELCRSGRERYCAKQTNFGYSLQGALAEYAIAPVAALVRVPAEMDAAALAPMCCAGWTAYGAVSEAGLAPGRRSRCSGSAGWDTWRCRSRGTRGLRVAVVDTSEAKLEMARADGAELTASGDDGGPHAIEELGRGGRGDRADRVGGGDSAGVQGPEAAGDAGAGRDVGEPVRAAAGGHGAEGDPDSRELSGGAEGSRERVRSDARAGRFGRTWRRMGSRTRRRSSSG